MSGSFIVKQVSRNAECASVQMMLAPLHLFTDALLLFTLHL